MRFRGFVKAATLALSLAPLLEGAPAKGHLFIVGGGNRTSELMSRFVELAGGRDRARIVVLPMASAEPADTGREQAQEIQALGVRDVSSLIFTREQAENETDAARLDGATGVFFSGGDQSRLTEILNGTAALRKIKQLYQDGAVIGGTSAGAAVMSALMITGDELLAHDPKEGFTFIKRENVKLVEGFGFLRTAIVDQHFVTRKRHNRLISAVLEHPALIGIGIDEATAIVVNPNGMFHVVGDNSVIVYDARKARHVRADARGNLGARDIRMHLLLSGDDFPLDRH